MTAEDLRKAILQQAIQGKLVPQNPNDEPASILLERIREEKARLVKEKKIKKNKNESIIYRGEDKSYYEKFADGTIKCIDEEIPFEIPESWEWCRLNDICIFLSRGKSPKYSEEKIYPVFAQKCNLKDGWISLEQARFLDPTTVNKWSEEYKLKTGDVLINSTGTGTVCRTRLFDEKCLGNYPFVVPDSHVSVVRTYKEINSTYIYYYILSARTQQYLLDNLAGTTNQKELYIGVISKMILPIPPLSEQKRIVARIEELMSRVDKFEQSKIELDKLESELQPQLKKSILQYAIQGKLVPQIEGEESASVLLEKIQQEKQKLLKEGKLKKKDLDNSAIFKGDDNKYYEQIGNEVNCIDEEIPFEIPESWRWSRMGNCCNLIGGYAFKSNEIKTNIGNRVIRISDISEEGLLNNNIVCYNGSLDLSQYKILKDDILIAMTGGTVGKSMLYNEDSNDILLLNQRVAIIRNVLCNNEYISFIIKSPYIKSIIDNCKNSTNDNISMNDIKNFLIPLPPLEEQKRIVEKITKINKGIESI